MPRILTISFLAVLPVLPGCANYQVLYNATNDISGYDSRLLLQNGSLFGTGNGDYTSVGGTFELSKQASTWNETDILTFAGSPLFSGGLIADSSGNLYGTTPNSGTYGVGGRVYELVYSGGAWTVKILWTFGSAGDGNQPASDLVMDSSGALYGTTQGGGKYNSGTVFKLTPNGTTWTENILYSFGAYSTDGEIPIAGLYRDRKGNLFGTTFYGGTNSAGTAFELSPSGGSWIESHVHSFGSGTDGNGPSGGLLADVDGLMWGTTQYGGAYGYGTVFEILPGEWKESVLYSFKGGNDGANPNAALCCVPAGATLYGTTYVGGAFDSGTVFQIDNTGANEVVLHSFGASNDGQGPAGALISDGAGDFYGTTALGGTNDTGTVFELTP